MYVNPLNALGISVSDPSQIPAAIGNVSSNAAPKTGGIDLSKGSAPSYSPEQAPLVEALKDQHQAEFHYWMQRYGELLRFAETAEMDRSKQLEVPGPLQDYKFKSNLSAALAPAFAEALVQEIKKPGAYSQNVIYTLLNFRDFFTPADMITAFGQPGLAVAAHMDEMKKILATTGQISPVHDAFYNDPSRLLAVRFLGTALGKTEAEYMALADKIAIRSGRQPVTSNTQLIEQRNQAAQQEAAASSSYSSSSDEDSFDVWGCLKILLALGSIGLAIAQAMA